MGWRTISFSALLCGLVIGCSNGGGSAALQLEGTLTQGTGEHSRLFTKHSSGEPIDEVQVCALGGCSTTDASGRWGFSVEGEFSGGDVAISVVGHGLDTAMTIHIPAGADSVVVALQNNGGNVVANSVSIDGVEHEHGSGDPQSDEEHDHGGA